MKRVAIIGAGAAGCFCAAQLRAMAPELKVTVFEAGSKPLAKVAITGGGRCNLTNSFEGIRSLAEAYPRGERLMKRALRSFSNDDTIAWFTAQGVPCVLQPDHCWFPQSQDAMDIVRALLRAMKGCDVQLNTKVTRIAGDTLGPDGPRYDISVIPSEARGSYTSYDYVVVTTGGAQHFPFLDGLDLEIVPPVPSLFTFNIPDPALKALMGLVVEAQIGLQGTPFKADSPLLITDWGLSGPATLKLSAYAARHLSENGYKGTVGINWLNANENEVRARLQETSARNPQKQLANTPLLQQRLWEHLIGRAGLRPDIRWAEFGSKGLNRLTAVLTNDTYPVSGKSKFREEFVTAGGVALSNIDINTLESKRYPGLFFAGEILDIDAITGGFNLQAAWSTGYVCAVNLIKTI